MWHSENSNIYKNINQYTLMLETRVCGGEFLTFNIFLRTKTVPILIVNWFCISMIYENFFSTSIIFKLCQTSLNYNIIYVIRKTTFNRIIKGYWYSKYISISVSLFWNPSCLKLGWKKMYETCEPKPDAYIVPCIVPMHVLLAQTLWVPMIL